MCHHIKVSLRKHLSGKHSEKKLAKWYDPLKITLSNADKCIDIIFPHPFFGDWFKKNIQETFEQDLQNFLGKGYGIKYGDASLKNRWKKEKKQEYRSLTSPYGDDYLFSTFTYNKKNAFPLEVMQNIIRQENVPYNPVIISGASGTGKTHILRAVANALSKKKSTVFIATAQELYNVYKHKFSQDTYLFNNHIKQFDYFFIDDFVPDKNFTFFEKEFIYIFDYFVACKKQMIFSCQDSLTKHGFFSPSLYSRLKSGLIMVLKKADLSVRLKHIENFCITKNITLTKEQTLTLAQHFTDFRQLKGLLLKFYAYREFISQAITKRDFERILAQTTNVPKKQIQPEQIIKYVSENLNVLYEELTGSSREGRVVLARQIAMYLCRDLAGCSYPVLGTLFGNRDHSTALYGVKKVKENLKVNKDLHIKVSSLRKKLAG